MRAHDRRAGRPRGVLAAFAVVVARRPRPRPRAPAGRAAVGECRGRGRHGRGRTPPEFEYESPARVRARDPPRVTSKRGSTTAPCWRARRRWARASCRAPRPSRARPAFADVTLPDGRPGRAVELRQPLRIEDAAPGGRAFGPSRHGARRTGRPRTHAETLAAMSRWLVGLGLLALGLGRSAAALAVTRGLRPSRASPPRSAAATRPISAAPCRRTCPGSWTRGAQAGRAVCAPGGVVRRASAASPPTSATSCARRWRPCAPRWRSRVARSRRRRLSRRARRGARRWSIRCRRWSQNLLELARLDAGQMEIANQSLRLRVFVDDCWRAVRGRRPPPAG